MAHIVYCVRYPISVISTILCTLYVLFSSIQLHFIFRHKNPVTGEIEEKHAKKPTGSFSNVFTDKRTHLFTLGRYCNTN